ncbi:MAG: hypothetical protein ACFFEF_06465 [Candidatus Thorarchaeota archaeon]
MIQLDPSNPFNLLLLVITVLIICIWILTEILYKGAAKGAIRVACAFILSGLIMLILYSAGLIVF